MPFIREIKIRNLKLKNNLFLSPMAGITGYAFRKICLENGCGLAISEMVSSESIYYNNSKSIQMLKIKDDYPTAIQIFGTNPEKILYTAKMAQENGAVIIEINAACPVKKIIKTGAGAALMENSKSLAKIIETLAKNINIPISVKIRAGSNKKDISVVDICKILENSGADCIHIHLRYIEQGHNGPVNFEIGKKIKENIKIPLIANGGIISPLKAKEMFEKTSCDAISIGRAAVNNPSIFKEINDSLTKGESNENNSSDKVEMFIKFLKLNCQTLGEEKGIKTARKIAGLWLKNIHSASLARTQFMKINNLKDAVNFLNSIK